MVVMLIAVVVVMVDDDLVILFLCRARINAFDFILVTLLVLGVLVNASSLCPVFVALFSAFVATSATFTQFSLVEFVKSEIFNLNKKVPMQNLKNDLTFHSHSHFSEGFVQIL